MDKTITLQLARTVVASINPNECVNCGTCRDYCPVEAISEKQKAICHLCPDCTEMKAITPDEVIKMQNEACTLSCPVGLSPQGFLNLLRIGKKREAFENIWNKNPLPAICGYVCHHPCESDCKRGSLVDRPMEIRAIQRFLSEEYIDYQPAAYPVLHQERIAVIGAGPAGLTAAHWLSQRGYKVTVFEQNAEAGGMMLRGIPAFRLDKDVLHKEIARLEKAGIEIIYNKKISDVQALLKDFDKVVLSVGTQVGKTLPIEGFRTEKIYTAVNLMERVNAGQKIVLSGNVVVIGGGSVAVDTARTALRLGADKVTMICLESGAQVPAHDWELEEAKEEGIDLIKAVAPQRFLGSSSKLTGIEYAHIENFNPKDGSFKTLAGTETVLPADAIIFAIGQRSDKQWQKHEDIIFAGDIASGKCSVVDAMASGREAALKIDNELRNREYSDFTVERTVSAGDLNYKIYPAVRRKLDFSPLENLAVEERIHSFDIVEKGLTEDSAELESLRCLQCGYQAVDADKCIGCGVCQKVCPAGNVISMVAVSESEEV